MTPQLTKLIKELEKLRLDALLITNEANISYLTAFDAQDSWLFVSKKRCFYITDFRYVEEARHHLKGIKIKKSNGSIFNLVGKLALSQNIRTLGFESRHISHAEYKAIKKELPRATKYVPTVNVVELLRQIKTSAELFKIKRALHVTKQSFGFLKNAIKPGIRESDLEIALSNFIRTHGCRYAFNPIIASGINASYPHAKVTNRLIKRGEPIIIDMGVDYLGYKSDLTRVFFLGKIPSTVKHAYEIVLEAQLRAIKKIKAGALINEVDSVARNYIKSKGLGKYFGHALGHGIGRETHEFPPVSSKNESEFAAGMVVTVEPAVYLSGKFGIRIEDMVLVKNNGCEILSADIDKSN
ncbi:M24 family metallopeptidase [Candidatus Omnitrophota bacterium]